MMDTSGGWTRLLQQDGQRPQPSTTPRKCGFSGGEGFMMLIFN
jgi:hypothetical protein